MNESFCSNGSSKNSCLDISLNENSFMGITNRNNLSKKELKMLRNRISAQKSRDRKKKEEKEYDVLTLLEQNGVRNSRGLYNDILEAMKGEEKVVSSLKIKEYHN
jgi:hypothetical protein